MHVRYIIEDFSFLSNSRYLFTFYLVTKSMTFNFFFFFNRRQLEQISPSSVNTHHVHYRIQSSQPYYSFVYLPTLQYFQYITHDKLNTAVVPCYY